MSGPYLRRLAKREHDWCLSVVVTAWTLAALALSVLYAGG